MTDTYVDPTTYAVIPRQWKVIDHPEAGKVVAAMLPYPGALPEDRACAGNPDFTDEKAMRSSIKRTELANICAGCSVRTACEEYAIAHEDFGMWAGTLPQDRRYIRKRRRQLLVEPQMAHVYGLLPDPFDFLHAGSGGSAEDSTD